MDTLSFIKNSVLIFFQKEKAYTDLAKTNIKNSILWMFLPLVILYTLMGLVLLIMGEISLLETIIFILLIIVFSGIIVLITIGIIGIYQVSYMVFGGKGKFKDMINLFTATYVGSGVLSLPVMIVFYPLFFLIKNELVLGIILIMYAIVILGIWIWYLVTATKYFAKLHKLTLLKSFFALIIPTLLFIGLGLLLVALGTLLQTAANI
ncbi:MAG: YIP1 family protein [Candidatus Woesearchaeota archaeon]|jgi:hypothetical protein|nr:YIP1 family protein [Candidatus Woesearchaeota archaeon]